MVAGAPPPGKRRERSVESLSDEVGWSWYQWRLFIVTGLCVSAESIEVNLLSFISIEVGRRTRGLHLSTVQLNLSALYAIGGEREGL